MREGEGGRGRKREKEEGRESERERTGGVAYIPHKKRRAGEAT